MMEQIQKEAHVKTKVKKPNMYKVILLNDDYTSMEFVVEILMSIFHHSSERAIEIMYDIHKKGRGICGVYTFEIAETKVMHVHMKAQEQSFPLRAVIEEE